MGTGTHTATDKVNINPFADVVIYILYIIRTSQGDVDPVMGKWTHWSLLKYILYTYVYIICTSQGDLDPVMGK